MKAGDRLRPEPCLNLYPDCISSSLPSKCCLGAGVCPSGPTGIHFSSASGNLWHKHNVMERVHGTYLRGQGGRESPFWETFGLCKMPCRLPQHPRACRSSFPLQQVNSSSRMGQEEGTKDSGNPGIPAKTCHTKASIAVPMA